MAKELPYFKFEPNQWENGNIQVCSFEAQGIFIHVCSMYWQRLGNLPYKLAVQKICKGNATAFDSLIEEDVIKVIDGHICIDFLNEQLAEFETTSKVNSENARQGWLKRKNNANTMRPHSDPNAIRGEKIREERENTVTHGKGKKTVTIKRVFAGDPIHKIHDLREYYRYTGQIEAMEEIGLTYFDAFIEINSGKVFNEPDHLYNSFRNFCKEYVPPARAPSKYENAEYNKTLWTVEAWEQFYQHKLLSDPDFRKHFGYGELFVSKAVG